MTGDFRIGDPAIDLANGRALVVLDKAADRADEWSEQNGYDLLDNYGNERLGTTPEDSVYTCAYVASLQSEPSKTYDFPESRLGRPAYERADEGRRIYDRVAVDVLAGLFEALTRDDASHLFGVPDSVERVSEATGVEEDAVVEAMELGEVEARFGGSE